MWIKLLYLIVLAAVGVGMYFTGRAAGIEWVLEHTRIEVEDEQTD